ncbi:hypothetical protein CBM2587_B60327 [Cupriavidus taiwanensis]|uniref:Uncharacterized protein n=1 Tax=Cupriavidus taiwanensis TaxID=164546 RepID=A0A375C659_9BURK|nr:hypothetical protein CBM2587_B60327 [Cupriavidus taiwanensis]
MPPAAGHPRQPIGPTPGTRRQRPAPMPARCRPASCRQTLYQHPAVRGLPDCLPESMRAGRRPDPATANRPRPPRQQQPGPHPGNDQPACAPGPWRPSAPALPGWPGCGSARLRRRQARCRTALAALTASHRRYCSSVIKKIEIKCAADATGRIYNYRPVVSYMADSIILALDFRILRLASSKDKPDTRDVTPD